MNIPVHEIQQANPESGILHSSPSTGQKSVSGHIIFQVILENVVIVALK